MKKTISTAVLFAGIACLLTAAVLLSGGVAHAANAFPQLAPALSPDALALIGMGFGIGRLADLRAEKTRMTNEARQILDAAGSRDLTADETRTFDDLMKKADGVQAKIERQEKIDDFDRRAAAMPVGSGDARLDGELQNFSLRRAVLSQVPGHNIDCAREVELGKELALRSGREFKGIAVPLTVFRDYRAGERRNLTSTTTPGSGAGGSLIATDYMGEAYIDRLRAALITRQLGAQVLSGLVGNVAIPKLKTSATAGWVAENSSLSQTDIEATSVTMSPKHAGVLTEYSRNMLLQASPDIDMLLRNDFAALLANCVDAAGLRGGGTSEPVGILASGSGITKISMNAAPTWAKVLDLIYQIDSSDALAGSLGFAAAPRVVKTMRSTLRASSTDSRMIMEEANALAGYPLLRTTNLRGNAGSPQEGELIFGNWSDLLIGYWSEFDLLVNPFETTAFKKGNVQVRGMVTMDVAMRHVESFTATTDMAVS